MSLFSRIPRAASLQRARGRRGAASGVAGHAVELLLERLHLPRQRVLALVETLHALRVRFLAVAQSAYLVGDPVLVAGDCLGGVHSALDVLLAAGLAALLELPPRVLEAVQGGKTLRERPALAAGAGAAHGVGRLLQAIRRFLQSGRRVVAGETLEAAAQLVRLLGQSPLLSAARCALPAGRAGGAPALALDLLLLATRQLAKALHRLVDGLVELLALPALHRLVLVLELVELQLEEIRQLVGARGPTLSATSLAEGHLHVAERGLRPLQVLERPLLGSERGIQPKHLQLLHGCPHLDDGLLRATPRCRRASIPRPPRRGSASGG